MSDDLDWGSSEDEEDCELMANFGAYNIKHDPLKISTVQGSFHYDLNLASFNIQWASHAEFEAWLEQETKSKSFNFSIHETVKEGCKKYPKYSQYTQKIHYCCSCNPSGGRSLYVRKTAHNHAIPSQWVRFGLSNGHPKIACIPLRILVLVGFKSKYIYIPQWCLASILPATTIPLAMKISSSQGSQEN
jgi:hypothetical protein